MHRKQEAISAAREDIDRQRKLLMKKKPQSEEKSHRGRKSAGPSTPTNPGPSNPAAMFGQNQNSADGFLKPENPRDKDATALTSQEYYEKEEILKVGFNPMIPLLLLLIFCLCLLFSVL